MSLSFGKGMIHQCTEQGKSGAFTCVQAALKLRYDFGKFVLVAIA